MHVSHNNYYATERGLDAILKGFVMNVQANGGAWPSTCANNYNALILIKCGVCSTRKALALVNCYNMKL